MPKIIKIAHIKAQKLWRMACKHDGVKPSTLFVEFRESNPYAEEYYKHMAIVLEYMTGE